jgi:hypothetical protein
MTQTADQALKSVTLYTDGEDYKLVHLPSNAITAAASVLAEIGTPFSALIADKDEVTLVITKGDLDNYAHRLPGHTASADDYRLITFDLELDPTLTGFMARVSQVLADAHVVIMPFAAFSRDHLLVPTAQFTRAIEALEKLRGVG